MIRRVAAAVVVVLALGGCGLGAGDTASDVRLRVSRDFGATTVRDVARPKTAGEDTIVRLLQRNARVRTAYGGGFVSGIDGLAGDQDGGGVDWFYTVNGVDPGRGAAAVRVHDGDLVWWDRRFWSAAQSIPAVVGAYPEPFRHGIGGDRLPVRVACDPAAAAACTLAVRRLRATGATVTRGAIADASPGAARVLVGRWTAVRRDPVARRIEDGPKRSGVFARPAAGGRSLTALDERGRTAARDPAGWGLVAATRQRRAPPVWVVTGATPDGALRAAGALDERTLASRFAVRLAPRGDGGGENAGDDARPGAVGPLPVPRR